MTFEQLEKAKELKHIMDKINDMLHIIHMPYPQFACMDTQVNSAEFDDETLKGLKEVIDNYLHARFDEIRTEFKNL